MSSGAEEDLRSLGLSPIEAKRSVWWINENERLAGHEAIGRALQGVGGGWALVGRAMTITSHWFRRRCQRPLRRRRRLNGSVV